MPSPLSKTRSENDPVQVMVVDDSNVVGDLVNGILMQDPRIQVAARPVDGADAVSQFRKLEAEVMVLDIGGQPKESLTTLSRLLRTDTKARIIFCFDPHLHQREDRA